MAGLIVIETTTATAEEAERIAAALLAEGLAACVQIAEIRSRYVWRRQVERADEQLLRIKTRAELFEPVRARIRAMHAYETPEIIALPVTAADVDYAAWVSEVTRPRSAHPGEGRDPDRGAQGSRS